MQCQEPFPVQRGHVPSPGESWGTDSCSVDVACDGMVCHEDGPAVPDHPLSGPSIPDAWAYPFWCSSLWAGTMGTRELGHDGQSRPGLIPFGFGIYDSECRVMYTVWTHAAEQPGAMWPRLPRISMFSGEGSPPRSPACLLVGYPRGLLARLEFDCNPPGLLCQRALAELWLPVAGTSPHQRRSLGDHGHDLWIGRCLVPASWNFFVELCWRWRWSRALPRQLDTIGCGAFSRPLGMCWLWTGTLCRL